MEAANFKYEHPRGTIYGYIGESGVRALQLPDPNKSRTRVHFLHSAPNIMLGRVLHRALDHYFAGVKEDFGRIPLDLSGATFFQQSVWQAARAIPWGETVSYGDLAKRIGRPTAVRAVGRALGANPIPIIIPCHRILAADGGLGGFAAGLAWKELLLMLEGALRKTS